jgi:hypothetical protein
MVFGIAAIGTPAGEVLARHVDDYLFQVAGEGVRRDIALGYGRQGITAAIDALG